MSRIENEKKFIREHLSSGKYGPNAFLIDYFLASFRNPKDWRENIIPYLRGLQAGLGMMDDWTSVPWGGAVCFRQDHVMIIDAEVPDAIDELRDLRNVEGELILGEDGNPLLDTRYIESHHSSHVKLSPAEMIRLAETWVRFLNENE